MSKIVIYVVILLVGLLVGVGISRYLSYTVTSTATTSPAQVEEPKLSAKSILDQGTSYMIDIKYPQFGLRSIDPQISAELQRNADEFKLAAVEEESAPTTEKFELTITYDKPYIGPDIVGALLYITTYTGGAHPSTQIEGYYFDRATGARLTVEDAVKLTGLSLEDISKKATAQLASKLGDAFFTEGASAIRENYAAFGIDAETVTFIFQPYQVAAYAAGPQEVSFKRK